MQYFPSQHQTFLSPPVTSTLSTVFAWLSLFIPSGAISLLFLGSILDTFQPERLIFPCHIFLPFQYCSWGLTARILEWFAIPFSTGPHFVRTLLHDPFIFGDLHDMAHSFIDLDKAVVHVLRLFQFSVIMVFSLSAL